MFKLAGFLFRAHVPFLRSKLAEHFVTRICAEELLLGEACLTGS